MQLLAYTHVEALFSMGSCMQHLWLLGREKYSGFYLANYVEWLQAPVCMRPTDNPKLVLWVHNLQNLTMESYYHRLL